MIWPRGHMDHIPVFRRPTSKMREGAERGEGKGRKKEREVK